MPCGVGGKMRRMAWFSRTRRVGPCLLGSAPALAQGGEDVLVGWVVEHELDSLQVRREFDVVPGKASRSEFLVFSK